MMNSVVKLHVDTIQWNPFVPFEKDAVASGAGSAFFISEKVLLTCYHCVEDAVNVSISLPNVDKATYKVKIIAVLPFLDLALLETEHFPHRHDHLQIDPGEVSILDSVITVGFPLNLNSLKYTKGVVSGLTDELIQIDAAINPGNSGGPLLRDNKVIGVNSRKLSDAESVGFAVSIRTYLIWAGQIVPQKEVVILRPLKVDIRISTMNADAVDMLRSRYGFQHPSGVIVTESREPSLQNGDVIHSLNGRPVDNFGDVANRFGTRVSLYKAPLFIPHSEHAELGVFRKGKHMTINIAYSPSKKGPIRDVYTPFESYQYIVLGGIVFMELAENHLRKQGKLNQEEKVRLIMKSIDHPFDSVVIISSILVGSPITSMENVTSGSIIYSVNGVKVDNLETLSKAFSSRDDYLQMHTSGGFFFIYPYQKLHAIDADLQEMYDYTPWNR